MPQTPDPTALLVDVFAGPVGTIGPGQVPTAFVKTRVNGPAAVGALGVQGDAQADPAVHGGPDMAVYAYPAAHYPHWRQDFPDHVALWGPGSLGENLSLDAWTEMAVCIGDVVSLGSALLQVTRPRKPCFKLALRFGDMRLPKHMVDTGRCGWYYRVLQPGTFAAGDRATLQGRPHPGWTIHRLNALSADPDAPLPELEALAALPKLAASWRNGVLTAIAASRARSLVDRFRPFTVTYVRDESSTIRSFLLQPGDGLGLPSHRPGQHVALRFGSPGRPAWVRAYSLSTVSNGRDLQISVKCDGEASTWLHEDVRVGSTVELLGPRGGFALQPNGRSILLLSVGVGVTPLMPMLVAATTNNGGADLPPRIVFIHGARSGAEHAFATDVCAIARRHPSVTTHIRYSAPGPDDCPGVTHDSVGRIDRTLVHDLIAELDEYDVYLCGPTAFMADARRWLTEAPRPPVTLFLESFETAIAAQTSDPEEAVIRFAASGRSALWRPGQASLLELAEQQGIAVRSNCRVGLCGTCTVRRLSGTVAYDPEPLAIPGADEILLCCASPRETTLVLDI